ncbi:MAG: hypothetical protein NW206_16240 [Hyphomonadaceae bacterium]|nr:hypothetical protein [Hyphomonadaceae bacterium]
MQSKMRAALAAAVLALLAGSCSSGRTQDTRDGFTDAARTPFRDVGLIRPEIPAILRTLDYPYNTGSLAPGCSAVAYEIAQLDAVLGPESFQPGPDRNIWDRGGDFVEDQTVDAMRGTAEDLIPFRSWVRRISGASSAEREALRAFANGQQRRTFLRGYGASLGCTNMIPAPPPPRPAENR